MIDVIYVTVSGFNVVADRCIISIHFCPLKVKVPPTDGTTATVIFQTSEESKIKSLRKNKTVGGVRKMFSKFDCHNHNSFS